MNLSENTEIKEISKRLEQGMLEYIEPGITAYSAKEVQECMQLLNQYLERMENAANKQEGMEVVKKTVLALNELNDKAEYELIETEQREDIAEIIILAGHLKGYNDREEDITEEWRDW